MSGNEHLTTKNQIMKQAIEMIRQKGYSNVTVDDICQKVGVTKTTFYYHYKSKDELITNFFTSTDHIAGEQLSSILAADNYAEQLRYIMELYVIRIKEAGPAVARELYKANLTVDHEILAPDDLKLRDIDIMLLEKAQKAGQIKNMTPADRLYNTLVYAMTGVCLFWAMKEGKFDLVSESRKTFDEVLLVQ